MNKKLNYEAPTTELVKVSIEGVILVSLNQSNPSSTGPAAIDSEDIHDNGLW